MPSKTTREAQRSDAEGRATHGDSSSSQASPEPETGATVREGKSVGERARPYLLAVAMMPFGVLDTRWTIGKNRCLDRTHVRELKEVFRRMGPERRADEHHLRVLCSAEEVRRMRAQADGRGEEPVKDFLGWAAVNPGKVEVMAGQHRMQALRDYAEEGGLPESELWWTCELYDRGEQAAAGRARPGGSDEARGHADTSRHPRLTRWQIACRTSSTSSSG